MFVPAGLFELQVNGTGNYNLYIDVVGQVFVRIYMKLDITTEGKLPDHFWKIVFVIVACACGINKDSILLIMGV